MSLPRFFERTGRLLAMVTLFCGLLLLMVWASIWRQLADNRQAAIDAAVQRNSNLAVSLEQYAIRTIRNADALMQLVRYEYAKDGRLIDLRSLVAQGVIDPHDVAGVSINDA